MLLRHQIFSEQACAALATKIEGLERLWTRRHDDLPSFTLGASAYLDLPNGIPKYIAGGNRGNMMLKRHFADENLLLMAGLKKALDAPVFMTKRYAQPGFHIFKHHPDLEDLKPSMHWDLQEVQLPDYEGTPGPPGSRFSFTLPLRLPASGGGLQMWDALFDINTHKEVLKFHKETQPPSTHHAYALGEAFIHSGLMLHQIATATMPGPGEARVTWQGHGKKTDRGWELYW